MSEMLECLEQDTERMIVILEDSDAEMNVLLNFNPEMTQKFNHRIVLKQYTVNELVEMARKFARKRQYEVSDDALLELYLKIDKLRNNVDNIRMDDIKEIINHAIVKAEKRGSKRFFGGLKRKRGENGDVTILVEAAGSPAPPGRTAAWICRSRRGPRCCRTPPPPRPGTRPAGPPPPRPVPGTQRRRAGDVSSFPCVPPLILIPDSKTESGVPCAGRTL